MNFSLAVGSCLPLYTAAGKKVATLELQTCFVYGNQTTHEHIFFWLRYTMLSQQKGKMAENAVLANLLFVLSAASHAR